jgi:hypothetical protein
MKSISFVLPALLALAACDGGTQGADSTTEEEEAKGNVVANSSVAPAPSDSTAIPAAIRGRWGLVPADCEPGRDDAKGLLTITATKLEFYESVATLGAIAESAPTRLRASFDFEGEGMTWQGGIELSVEDGGTTLTRREYGENSANEPFRYAKCNQG